MGMGDAICCHPISSWYGWKCRTNRPTNGWSCFVFNVFIIHVGGLKSSSWLAKAYVWCLDHHFGFWHPFWLTQSPVLAGLAGQIHILRIITIPKKTKWSIRRSIPRFREILLPSRFFSPRPVKEGIMEVEEPSNRRASAWIRVGHWK